MLRSIARSLLGIRPSRAITVRPGIVSITKVASVSSVMVGDRFGEHRYQCSPLHCQSCSLASRCCQNPSRGRTIKRLEGQELLDTQREKMNEPCTKQRYRLRGQTVERGFGDAKGNRRFDRYHGRGLRRARAETGLLVLAQNLMILDRLERNAANHHEIKT